MVLLPYDFLLFSVFGSNSRGRDTNLWILYLETLTKIPETAVVRSAQFSWFEGLLLLQLEVLVDQGQRSNENAQRTAPKHLFDFRKKAMAQVLLSAHANLKVLPEPQCPKVFLHCLHLT